MSRNQMNGLCVLTVCSILSISSVLLLSGCTHTADKRVSDLSEGSDGSHLVRYSIKTAEGGSLFKFLNAEPDIPSEVCLVLFPGGRQLTHFDSSGGNPRLSNNFLMRIIPNLVGAGYRVAVPSTLSNAVKTNENEKAELREMFGTLEREGCLRMYLIATSRGAVSAFKSLALTKARVAGVALTATIAADADFSNLQGPSMRLPILLIHHRFDNCTSSPLPSARELSTRLAVNADIEFHEIDGGSEESTNPCSAKTHHGFWGVENQTVAILTRWLSVAERKKVSRS